MLATTAAAGRLVAGAAGVPSMGSFLADLEGAWLERARVRCIDVACLPRNASRGIRSHAPLAAGMAT